MSSGNIFGSNYVIVSFGESHGKCVGVVIDGCPAGLKLDLEHIQNELNRRKPGQSKISTPRKETDRFEILSGIFNGFTTGAPITLIVKNKDIDSSKYEKIKDTPRPGHADFTAWHKYGGFNDYRGGGRFSGRVTISFVLAGAIAKQLLKETLQIEILAHTVAIGGIKLERPVTIEEIKTNTDTNPVRCADPKIAEKMIQKIEEVRQQGDSVGGIVETISTNIPVGLGEPLFRNIESEFSRILFAIPAVKGVEFGAGFKAADLLGSQHNDPFIIEDNKIKTETNNAGGILGGISNGMPITCRIAIKPTASIAKSQKTVNLKSLTPTEISVEGRHDPAIVPRAVPVVEAALAIVLADLAIQRDLIPHILKKKG
ncbi:MAG: chorismate synthase [Candidatus Helarchaeota archaeon]|nr:chorismate synthase [Candidatus Helarchaeota archaeon]